MSKISLVRRDQCFSCEFNRDLWGLILIKLMLLNVSVWEMLMLRSGDVVSEC